VCETNIVALHDQTPHISLPNPPFLRSRLHRFSRRRTFLSKRKREEGEEEEEEILIIKVNKKFQKSFFLLSNEKTFSDEKRNKRHAIGPLTDFLERDDDT
jgi:hypothetical protein